MVFFQWLVFNWQPKTKPILWIYQLSAYDEMPILGQEKFRIKTVSSNPTSAQFWTNIVLHRVIPTSATGPRRCFLTIARVIGGNSRQKFVITNNSYRLGLRAP